MKSFSISLFLSFCAECTIIIFTAVMIKNHYHFEKCFEFCIKGFCSLCKLNHNHLIQYNFSCFCDLWSMMILSIVCSALERESSCWADVESSTCSAPASLPPRYPGQPDSPRFRHRRQYHTQLKDVGFPLFVIRSSIPFVMNNIFGSLPPKCSNKLFHLKKGLRDIVNMLLRSPPPGCVWAQRPKHVILTICLTDCKVIFWPCL